MTLNGKQQEFNMDDLRQCAKNAFMIRGREESIVREIQSIFSRWRDYADKAGVEPGHRDRIQGALLVRESDRL
jgi:hypothetical protein